MVETIFMALVLVLLIYIAYISYKTHVATQITLAGFVAFLQSVEEDEYGEEITFH